VKVSDELRRVAKELNRCRKSLNFLDPEILEAKDGKRKERENKKGRRA